MTTPAAPPGNWLSRRREAPERQWPVNFGEKRLVCHDCNLSSQEGEQKDHEFKASQDSIVCFEDSVGRLHKAQSQKNKQTLAQ